MKKLGRCQDCIFYEMEDQISGICLRFPPVPALDKEGALCTLRTPVPYNERCGEFEPNTEEENVRG